MPTVVGLGRAVLVLALRLHLPFMELSQSLICRGAFGFSQPRTRKRKKEYENLTVKTLPAKEVASFICFGGKKTVK